MSAVISSISHRLDLALYKGKSMQAMMLTATGGQEETLQATAHALPPARIIREELRHFTGTTSPSGPYEGCVRRCAFFNWSTASLMATPRNGSMCWPRAATFSMKCP